MAVNEMVVDRLKMLQRMHALKEMVGFKRGDQVSFERYGETIHGRVTRLNQKTVSIEEANGQRWTVSPQCLSHTMDITKAKKKKKRIR